MRIGHGVTEGAAYGAALLAGVGAGLWPDVETACEAVVRITDHVSPNRRATQTYDQLYRVYHGLYEVLKPTFDTLTAFSLGAQ